MAKRKNSASLKGVLDIDFNSGIGTITEVIKDVENEYDLFALLSEFNGKTVTINVSEENELPTLNEEN